MGFRLIIMKTIQDFKTTYKLKQYKLVNKEIKNITANKPLGKWLKEI